MHISKNIVITLVHRAATTKFALESVIMLTDLNDNAKRELQRYINYLDEALRDTQHVLDASPPWES